MHIKTRALMLATAAALAGSAVFAQAQAPTPGANSVRSGVEAWQAGNYDVAIRTWRPLADRGDADAQYNIAQAYFLGRGVPQNMTLAEQWYERAARQGHEEAQANYGLLLFQNGRRREAMQWIERSAERGDPRAQYVFGTALFNGDLIPQDLPRAYALMARAAQQNLPPAVTQLAEMERHLTPQDRARGVELARALRTAPQPVAAPAGPTRVAAASVPPSSARPGMQTPPRVVRQTPSPAQAAPRQAAPAPAPAAGGRWRIQLGAFSNEANARRAWSAVSGRLGGLSPSFVRAGAVVRLQAGPLRDRAAAVRACAGAGGGCFPVAP